MVLSLAIWSTSVFRLSVLEVVRNWRLTSSDVLLVPVKYRLEDICCQWTHNVEPATLFTRRWSYLTLQPFDGKLKTRTCIHCVSKKVHPYDFHDNNVK